MNDLPATRFRITAWDETPAQQLGGDSKIVTAKVSQVYEGGLKGQSSVVYVMHYRDEKSARFVGYESIECEYLGRSGTFVIAHDGEYSAGKASSSWQVVAGSATGDLAGLSGGGSFEAGHGGEATVTLNLKLA